MKRGKGPLNATITVCIGAWSMRPTAEVTSAMRKGYGKKGGEKPGVGISLLLTKGAKGTTSYRTKGVFSLK